MTCEIEIEGIQAIEPYSSDGRPSKLDVIGRTNEACGLVSVTVTIPNGPVLYTGIISPSSDAQNAPGIFNAIFDLDWGNYDQRALFCDTELDITAVCVNDPLCVHSDRFRIQCKDRPEPASDPTEDWDWWPFPWPPQIHCFTSHQLFLASFTAALLAIVNWAATPLPNGWGTAALSLLGVATVAWFAWTGFAPFGLLICNPDNCKRLMAFIWCFKWGVIFGVLIVIGQALQGMNATSLPALLIPMLYGITAGLLVNRAKGLNCRVPSARTLPQNLPH